MCGIFYSRLLLRPWCNSTSCTYLLTDEMLEFYWIPLIATQWCIRGQDGVRKCVITNQSTFSSFSCYLDQERMMTDSLHKSICGFHTQGFSQLVTDNTGVGVGSPQLYHADCTQSGLKTRGGDGGGQTPSAFIILRLFFLPFYMAQKSIHPHTCHLHHPRN